MLIANWMDALWRHCDSNSAIDFTSHRKLETAARNTITSQISAPHLYGEIHMLCSVCALCIAYRVPIHTTYIYLSVYCTVVLISTIHRLYSVSTWCRIWLTGWIADTLTHILRIYILHTSTFIANRWQCTNAKLYVRICRMNLFVRDNWFKVCLRSNWCKIS